MKILNLFKKDYIISQGLHSQSWAKKIYENVAIDLAIITPLYAPFDGQITGKWSSPNARQKYFSFSLPGNFQLVAVHAFTNLDKGQKFKKGDPIGYCTWHHYHIFLLNPVNIPVNFLDYSDRSIRMYTQASLYGTSDHPDGKWSSYKDLYLTTIINSKYMLKIENTQSFKNLNETNQNALKTLDKETSQLVIADEINRLRKWLKGTQRDRDMYRGLFDAKSKEFEKLKKDIEELQEDGKMAEGIYTENAELKSTINRLKGEVQELKDGDIYIEPLTSQPETFSFNKMFTGFFKFGVADGGILATAIVFIPEVLPLLEGLPEEYQLIGGITAGTLVITLKSIYQIAKKLNEKK